MLLFEGWIRFVITRYEATIRCVFEILNKEHTERSVGVRGWAVKRHPSLLLQFLNLTMLVIMAENVAIAVSLGSHDGSTDLAHTDSVAPTRTEQDKATGNVGLWVDLMTFHDEGGTVKVGIGKETSNFQFLANDHFPFCADYAQFDKSAACPAFYGLKVDNVT